MKNRKGIIKRFFESDFYYENSNEINTGFLIACFITYVIFLIFIFVISIEIIEKWLHL